jgi:4'-phosphopantetheinyl transferase EntD
MGLATLADVLPQLVPGDARSALAVADLGHVELLTPEETEVVARAVPARQAEFATGRMLLRQLLAACGHHDVVSIGRQPNGAPRLPEGFCASLAHSTGVVAAVARCAGVRLGLDIERRRLLTASDAEVIVHAHDDVDDPFDAFVAKEAIYKSWSTPERPMLEHHDIGVRCSGGHFMAIVHDDGSRFEGRLADASGPDGSPFVVAVAQALPM